MTETIEVLPKDDFIKCPSCECVFLKKSDLKRHLGKFGREDHREVFKRFHRKIDAWNDDKEWELFTWSKGKYGNGEITLASNDTRLARSIEQQGQVRMGMYLYTLSNDKKWIIRKITPE